VDRILSSFPSDLSVISKCQFIVIVVRWSDCRQTEIPAASIDASERASDIVMNRTPRADRATGLTAGIDSGKFVVKAAEQKLQLR
jgi:hypothetical protein